MVTLLPIDEEVRRPRTEEKEGVTPSPGFANGATPQGNADDFDTSRRGGDGRAKTW
jgi:hypothetical protein